MEDFTEFQHRPFVVVYAVAQVGMVLYLIVRSRARSMASRLRVLLTVSRVLIVIQRRDVSGGNTAGATFRMGKTSISERPLNAGVSEPRR